MPPVEREIPDDYVVGPGDHKRGAKLFKRHCFQVGREGVVL